jgi:hypothetical protein
MLPAPVKLQKEKRGSGKLLALFLDRINKISRIGEKARRAA